MTRKVNNIVPYLKRQTISTFVCSRPDADILDDISVANML